MAERGVWIEQFTTVDPHPVEWTNGNDDDPINIWDNVRFADNYWQSNAIFEGEEVVDAANVYFPDGHLAGGYGYFDGGNHSDVHLWYHGTIDTDGPIDDGSASVSEDAGWYDGDMGPRDQIGFHYSRIGGGDRTGDVGVGLANSGNRVVSAQSGTQWANLESDLIYSGSSAVNQGTAIPIVYRYQATANCNIAFGYDSDRNPYNGLHDVAAINQSATSSGSEFDNGSIEVHYLDTTSVPSGTHYLYAKVTSAGHTRYAYTTGQVAILVGNPIPGDANRDGTVDQADAAIVAANWLKQGGWANGDFNNDQQVNDIDATLMATNWLQTLPPTTFASAATEPVVEAQVAVPEVSYDLDNNGKVDLGDLAFFASVYREKPGITTESPYAYAADFDRSGTVDLGDLALFAANYRLGRPNDLVASQIASSVAAPPALLPGDANRDGAVDDTDSATLAHNWQKQTAATWADGDFNADGRVDNLDATILAQHWMMTVEDMEEDDARDKVFAAVGATGDALGLFDQ